MEGIEILSLTSIYNALFPEWAIAIGIILVFVFLIAAVAFLCAERYVWLISCLVLMMVTLIVTVCGSADNTNNVNYIEYKVTINDSVKMNDFLERYEILDQEGKIYTVRERE